MPKNLVAKVATSIAADKRSVWDALVTPEAIKQYMFDADVETDWKVGSKITWSGVFKGKPYQDKGEILQIDPLQTLVYSHFSPLAGKPDTPENYHTVTIRLAGNDKTTEVTLAQDNNPDEKGRQETEQNWRAMLEGLKQYVEKS